MCESDTNSLSLSLSLPHTHTHQHTHTHAYTIADTIILSHTSALPLKSPNLNSAIFSVSTHVNIPYHRRPLPDLRKRMKMRSKMERSDESLSTRTCTILLTAHRHTLSPLSLSLTHTHILPPGTCISSSPAADPSPRGGACHIWGRGG